MVIHIYQKWVFRMCNFFSFSNNFSTFPPFFRYFLLISNTKSIKFCKWLYSFRAGLKLNFSIFASETKNSTNYAIMVIKRWVNTPFFVLDFHRSIFFELKFIFWIFEITKLRCKRKKSGFLACNTFTIGFICHYILPSRTGSIEIFQMNSTYSLLSGQMSAIIVQINMCKYQILQFEAGLR